MDKYIQEKKDIQNNLLRYIDDEGNIEENYRNLITKIQIQKISENISETQIFFKLLVKIADYHFRAKDFFSKIEKIIL